MDWGRINYTEPAGSSQGILSITKARPSGFPRDWPGNRLNNVAIAVAPNHDAIMVYDNKGAPLLDCLTIGHVNIRQIGMNDDNSMQSGLKPKRTEEWDVIVSFTTAEDRLILLKSVVLSHWGALSDQGLLQIFELRS